VDEGGEIRGGSCIGPWRELERTGRKKGEGRGRKRRTRRGGKRPWREKMSEVERTGENWTQERGRKGKEAENAKGGETPLEREDE